MTTTTVNTGNYIAPFGNYQAVGLAYVFTDGSTVYSPEGDGLPDATPASWTWDVINSDGATIQTGTGDTFNYTFPADGTYTVIMTAFNEVGAGYATSSAPLTVATSDSGSSGEIQTGQAPRPGFQAQITGEAVVFTDQSLRTFADIQSWAWDFGDGTGTSTDQNPTYTYTAPGTYTVTLTVTDNYGQVWSASVAQAITIAAAVAVTADFNTSANRLQVTFTDASTTSANGATIDLWHWDFGDGNVSNTQNPVHTYSSAGTYTVTLTAGDSLSNTAQDTVGIEVATPAFGYVIAGNGLTVTFSDTSTTLHPPINAWAWDFGDGATSNSQNPSHTYAEGGSYTVSLTITDDSGAQAPVTQSVVLSVSSPTPTPSPSPTPTPTPSPTPTPTPSPSAPTYVLKGFVGISALASNTANTVATLGELSTYSRTFEQDILIFGGSTGGTTPASVDLSVFNSVNAAGTEVAVPSDYAATLLAISTWIYNQAVLGAFTADANVFQQALTTQYGSVINTITVDTMLTQGGIWMPSQVQFYFTNASTVAPSYTSDSRIKLWFSDQTFRSEYDVYTIAVVPPIDNLDDFFGTATNIQTEVNAVTLQDLMAKIATARNNFPETILGSNSYNWINPTVSGSFIPTNWTYLIWGAAGNNIDAIKQALQQYILANSTHTQAEWAQIFPDIFTSTEFIITPLWTQYAIPAAPDIIQGMYQPTVNPAQAQVMAENTTIGQAYTAQHIQNYMNVVPTAYKTLAAVVVGNPQNEGGIIEFQTRWADYLDVPTTSTDYDRMSQNTQGFVTLLYKLLNAAESMTDTSDLPVGITRLTRTNATSGDQVMYAVASYDNVDYLVVTKAYLVGKYGASTNLPDSIGISYSGTFANGAYQLLSSTETMQLQFTAENAVAPDSWSIVDTSISSASISPTGLFTGTFPTVGLYSLTLGLTDSQAHTVQTTFTFNFQVPQQGGGNSLAFGTRTLPEGTVGVAYNGTIQITGGTVPFTITNQTMPPGLSATIQGTEVIISGTPTQPSGTQNGTTCVLGIVDASTGTPQAASIQFSISIAAQGEVNVTVAPPSNLNVVVGTQYTGSCPITGGVSPYSLVTSTLPAGLNAAVAGNAVAISGTPSLQASGNFAATLTVADAQGHQGVVNFTYNVQSGS